MEYDSFFEEIKKFKEEQDKQKKRGLNDYNMVNVVRKATHEVGMHSNVIYSLINPDGLHYQDDLFLKLFIKEVLEIKDFGEVISVNAEDATEENRRIDFTIKSSNYYIGIEMKVNHRDSKHQISDYYNDLMKKAKEENIEAENVVIYYLTKDGKEANSISSQDRYYNDKYIEYKTISFKEHILKWVNSCQEQVRNITNLNEAFENYKNVVKKITGKYEGKVMNILEYVKTREESEQEQFIELLDSLESSYKIEKIKFLKSFFRDTLPNNLKELTKGEWLVEFSEKENGFNKARGVHIKIYKHDWDIAYWLKFNSGDLKNMYWAVAKTKESIKLDTIIEKFPKFNNPIIYNHKKTHWSLIWNFSKYDLHKNMSKIMSSPDDFSKYIYDEFINIIESLKNDYNCTLDEINEVYK